jgi:hypothetical protein
MTVIQGDPPESPVYVMPYAAAVTIVDAVILGATAHDVSIPLRNVDVVHLRDGQLARRQFPVIPSVERTVHATIVGQEDPTRLRGIENDVLLVSVDA